MIVDKNEYLDIQKKVEKYSSELVTKEELDSFNQHIEAKLLNFKPTLMIYGTYNAGKSTLLNALYGQNELAKTGDAPETKEVHEYKYNGYTIFDTPGLNARSDDDITTKEHLSKSEVILFVLSNNGSLEEEYVYEKISEVVKVNKPIIIVLNNKSGINPNSVESIELINKVGENLRKVGDRHGIENIERKVSICMVNAKTALKGKIENKKLILKKSNIIKLEQMIENFLSEAGVNEVINALNLYIQKFIDSVIIKIDNKIDNREVQKIEELITYLEKQKQGSQTKLENVVNRKIPIFSDTVTSMLLSENITEKKLKDYCDETVLQISEEIKNIYQQINSNLETKIDEFSKEFNEFNVNYDDIHISRDPNEKEDSFISDDIKNKFKETITDSKLTKEATKQILTKAKEWLPKDVMFGKGPVWINKVAGKAAIGISIAIEAYNMYSAQQEHQKMIQAERDRTLGAKNSAEELATNIKTTLLNSINETVNEIFNELIIGFKDESKKFSSNNSSFLTTKENLQSISNEL